MPGLSEQGDRWAAWVLVVVEVRVDDPSEGDNAHDRYTHVVCFGSSGCGDA